MLQPHLLTQQTQLVISMFLAVVLQSLSMLLLLQMMLKLS